MGLRNVPSQDDPAQSKRFAEAAKERGIEKVGKGFEKGLAVLAPKAKPGSKAGKPKRAKRAQTTP